MTGIFYKSFIGWKLLADKSLLFSPLFLSELWNIKSPTFAGEVLAFLTLCCASATGYWKMIAKTMRSCANNDA